MKSFPILLTSATLLALVGLGSAPALGAEPSPAGLSSAQIAVAAPPAPVAPIPSAAASAAPSAENEALREAGITPEIAQKLSSDQIYRILTQRASSGHGPEETIIPLTFFVFLFLGVSVGLYYGFRRDRERQETLRAMIQRGGTIPPELLVPPVKKFADLRRGIVLLAGGLGLTIFLGVIPTEHGTWTAGLIPLLLGAGYMLTHKLTKPEPQVIKDEATIAAEREVQSL